MTRPVHRGHGMLWRSTGLRLAALFGFLVLLGMLAALALVYLQVSVVLHANVERQLQQNQKRLVASYEQLGPQRTAQAISQGLSDGRDTDAELMLLVDAQGHRLAGNLQSDALAHPASGFQGLQRLQHGGAWINAQIMVHRFEDGALLILGHDLRELRDIESTVGTASVVAGLFALLLAGAGTWFFRRELARSVGALHATIMHITGGRLQSRIPALAAVDDEFTQLEHDFNQMLDRIEHLMSGVQHVSDTIAHNVRTPLTRIQLRMQSVLSDPAADTERLRDSMATATQEIDSLSLMLEKLLSIAQAEAGMRRSPFTELNWADIARDVIELYEDLADEERVTIEWRCEDPAPLLGDRSVLAGVVVNVLDNAIKYAGAGSRVIITSRTTRAAHAVVTSDTMGDSSGSIASFSELVIRDNGAALDEAAIASLGQRFVRLRPDREGHGLGLASVRAMMHLHGGEVHIASAFPGLAVTLRLPSITATHHTRKPHKQASDITVPQ